MDCRRESRRKGTPSATDLMKQRTDNAHEDLEDLIRFGATYSEIMERGPFASWDSMKRSLENRGRDDLLQTMRMRRIAVATIHPFPKAKEDKKKRRKNSRDVHDLLPELEELIY